MEFMTEGGFSPRTDTLLARAGSICAARGARLTELRREVLGLILDSESPTGAYELLDRLRATRVRAAPPTVYRALDFLLEHGLIHRVERLSAFVGCVAHTHAEDDPATAAHAAQFLICRVCGHVTELDDPELAHALADAARRLGFTVNTATIEAEGLCAACAARTPEHIACA
jgi:Fur family zinc uptake transcriptional regulator